MSAMGIVGQIAVTKTRQSELVFRETTLNRDSERGRGKNERERERERRGESHGAVWAIASVLS